MLNLLAAASDLTLLPVYLMVPAALLALVIHVVFAFAVYKDADTLVGSRPGTVLVGPPIWFLATLAGGVVIAGIYWVMHHSTLRAPDAPKPDAPPRP